MLYGDSGQRESAMFAKFDQFGTRILALMRRAGPVLFDIGKKRRLIEFSHPEYKNICTLKSPCFVGDADQVVLLTITLDETSTARLSPVCIIK